MIVIALAMAGCAPTPAKDAGFDTIRKIVADRTGERVRWNTHSEGDREIASTLRSWLTGELSVDQAVQIALLNNRHLQASYEDLGVAQAEVVQAGLLKNPVFDLSVRIPDRRPSKTYVDISVAENFLDALLIPAKRKLAETRFEQAKAQVAHDVMTLAADAKSAFYAYQASLGQVELRRTLADAAAASLDIANRMHDAGNFPDLAYTGERAQEARARIELASAEADAGVAREHLAALMGLWNEHSEWTVAPHLPDPPTAEVDPRGLEDFAVLKRLDLAAARQEVIAQARALGFTIDTRFFADASAGAEAERETDGQWRIGPRLEIPIPLFDQGQAAIPRAQAMLRQSQQRFVALAIDIRSEVRSARLRLFNARSRVMLYRNQVLPLQQQLLQQTLLQYNGMAVSVFQLLQAKRDEVDAAEKYGDALRDYWTARADLERAIGGRLPAVGNTTMPATTRALESRDR